MPTTIARQKSDYLQQKKLNPADELREVLQALEDRMPSLKSMNPTQVRILLRDLDQAAQFFTQLEANGVDLLPERGRFQTIQTHVRNQAAPLLKALGGPEALHEYRPKPLPSRERWWWYLHEIVAVQKKQLLKRVVIITLIIGAMISGIIVAFNTILAPSPQAVARIEAESKSLAAFEAGEYEQALAAVEKGLTVVPDDPGLLIIRGVLQEVLQRENAAIQSFAQAQSRLKDLEIFYLGRGQIYYQTNQLVKAEEDARAALALNESLSRSWLLLGQSLEAQGRNFEAIRAYQQAGEVALANGDNEVIVLARLALSRVGATP